MGVFKFSVKNEGKLPRVFEAMALNQAQSVGPTTYQSQARILKKRVTFIWKGSREDSQLPDCPLTDPGVRNYRSGFRVDKSRE